jgi:uncharacterized protein (TIGR03437 family)
MTSGLATISGLTQSLSRILFGICGLILASISAFGQIMIDTFAGGHVVSGAPAQNVALGACGITRDPNGNLVFCDGNHVIRRITAGGTVQTIAGTGIPGFSGDGGPAVSALLDYPEYPKYDTAGNLYFVDNNRIRRIDTSGTITTVAGTGIYGTLGTGGSALLAQIYYVTDLVIDSAGYIYFSEYSQPMLRRITPSGQVQVFAGCATCNDVDGAPATQSSIGSVTAMSLDSKGNLYLADWNGSEGHVYRISSDGIIHHFAGFGSTGFGPGDGNGGPASAAPPSKFLALFADQAGNLYTEESVPLGCGCVAIRRIGTDGNINLIAGDLTGLDPPNDGPALQTLLTGGGASSMLANGGILTFADGQLIREVTSLAMIQTIAGGQPQPAPDGTAALSAWFIQPNSIAFDRAGELYVGQACIIQKISSLGNLSTIAGTGQCGSNPPIGSALTTQLTPVQSIVVDSHDQVYFVDGYFGALYVVSTTGVISRVAELNPYGGPNLLAIDSQDRIYFLGSSADTFGVVAPGAAPQFVSLPSSAPSGNPAPLSNLGLAVDAADNVYVCCQQYNLILRYSPEARSFTDLNVGGPGVGGPDALAVDSSSNIWQGYGALGLWKGAFEFGSYGVYGDVGPAESATIEPLALAFAPNGDLYELDYATSAVRRIHGSPPTVAPAISAGGIVNAASYAGGAIAPGELISIFGSNFGPAGLDLAAPVNNVLPGSLDNVHVFFSTGNQVAIVARVPNQINVFVPYSAANQTSVQIVIDVDGVTSTPVAVPIAPSAFGISTADASGSGQGAILNQDGSLNSQSNPAARGTVVTLYGTGEGVTTPALPDGALEISTPYSTTQAPVTVKFGGETAQVQYAGAAPFLPTGVFQINATIPESVTPGDVPITVSIGGISTTRTVTVAVQ